MKKLLAIVAFLGCVQLAAADEKLPPGALKHGSLANAKLIEDTKVGVASKIASLGCTQLGDVDVYVTRMPAGEPGRKNWQERWIVSGCKTQYPLTLTFVEDATGASWTIS
jgi:hypothetical protein